MELLALVNLYKKCYLVFQNDLFRKRLNIHTAGVRLQVITRFHATFSKVSLFNSSSSFEKYIVIKNYCLANHNARVCFLPNCRSHIILTRDFGELLQNMDLFCLTYKHVECFFALLMQRFNEKSIVKCGKVFVNKQRLVFFNRRTKGVDRKHNILKKNT